MITIKNNITYLLLFLIFCPVISPAQSIPQPEIGKPMPDFSVDNIKNYKTTKASLKDFRGKWLIFDFWGINCKACIASFPKINQIQQEFPDKLQMLLDGK